MDEKLTLLQSYEQRRRWSLYCPGCGELWLVFNAKDKDEHICKGCGHRFIIEPSMRLPQVMSTAEHTPPLKRAA